VVICGLESIRWEVLPDALTRIVDPFFAVHHMEAGKTRYSLENIFAMERARRSINGTFPLSLFEILLATCFNHCSDPRDKIFAVLGLAKDWLEKGGPVPDYRGTTTPEKVYKRFAMWDVKKNGKIRILSCVAGHGEALCLPSWAPDWRKIENANPFVRYSDRTMFSASRNTSVDAWYSDHGLILNIMGKVVDSIKVIGSEPQFCRLMALFPFTEDSIEQLKRAQTWLQECQDQAADSDIGMTAQRYEQFWRTMTCGLTSNAFPAPAEYASYFKKYLEFIKFEMLEMSLPVERLSTETPPRIIHGLSDNHPDLQTHALIESSLEKWSSKRRFCTTIKGRLACVPVSAQTGDLICILHGGEVPYVLRPHGGGHYIVVGECYVDGVMHDEAFSGESYSAKRFELV
jgi:hypothetical protein